MVSNLDYAVIIMFGITIHINNQQTLLFNSISERVLLCETCVANIFATIPKNASL